MATTIVLNDMRTAPTPQHGPPPGKDAGRQGNCDNDVSGCRPEVWIIFRYVAWLNAMIRTSRESLPTSTTPPASAATSVPTPIAIPTSPVTSARGHR